MARIGPGGRNQKSNQYPIPANLPTSVFSMNTSDGDVITTLIMPSDGWVGHSTVANTNAGTGTALITLSWRDAAAGAGNALTGPHLNSSGGPVDLDAGGILYAADTTQLPPGGVKEGGRLFLFADFDGGSATAGGSWVSTIFLVI